jgi:hypothetical protein
MGKNLLLLKGSIAMIFNHSKTAIIHILILGEFNIKESWTRIFIIGPLIRVGWFIGAKKKGDMFFQDKDLELFLLDLNTQMIKDLGGGV